jgi:F-type H+-transporting ATPase subunit epsilon
MNTFSLILNDSLKTAQFDSVIRFVGADATGSFGIRPHHAEMIVLLRYGLARFQQADGTWYFLSLPGGVVHFSDNQLALSTTKYFIGKDHDDIVHELADEMAKSHSEIRDARMTMEEIEKALIRRFSALSAQSQGGLGR